MDYARQSDSSNRVITVHRHSGPDTQQALPLASPSNTAPDFTATTAASVSARRQHAIVLWKSQEGESRVSISGIEHSLGIQVAMPA